MTAVMLLLQVARQKLPHDWHKRLQAIQAKVSEAVKELPAGVLAQVREWKPVYMVQSRLYIWEMRRSWGRCTAAEMACFLAKALRRLPCSVVFGVFASNGA